MRITDRKLKLKVPSNRYMPSIIDEIRNNLTRMGVNGLTVDCRYDVKSNVGICRFNFNGKNYEMSVSNQRDVRANMWAISKRIEYKARMHLLGIESFDLSMRVYLALENKSGVNEYTSENISHASAKSYAILGLPEYASTPDIIHKYKELMRSFHPDMALSEEAKKEFEKKTVEINEAYANIKKERGI